MIIIAVLIAVIVVKTFFTYRLNTYDTVIAFTGGLGSGKSFLSVQQAVRHLRKARLRVWWHNLWSKRANRWEKPLLYSSIPVKVSRREMATILTDGHLLLQEHIVPRSIVYIDEVGGYCSQFDYKGTNTDTFDEFVRFFRHYTKGGMLIVNDQCSENIVLQVRRRLNTVYNLMSFRVYPCKALPLIYTVKVRNISVSEEIKTVEEQDTEDNMTTLIGLMPSYRRYDTYCYSNRYNRVPSVAEREHPAMKQDKVLRMSKQRVRTLDQRIEAEEIEQTAQNDDSLKKLNFVQFVQTLKSSVKGLEKGE